MTQISTSKENPVRPSMDMGHLDPVHDIFLVRKHPLDAIFKPRSVAVVGATEKHGSVGRTVLWNLVTNPFGGIIYPVNLKRPSVLGIKAYPSVKEIPDTPDLAVIVTPAPMVPDIIRDCVECGIKGAIVISAGFKEMGPEGAELERQIMEIAAPAHMRIIGPNCLGVMVPSTGFNATFAGDLARPGNVGFISQSGALCTAVLDWSLQHNVGFSSFISIGSMVDVDWGDLIHYLGNDPQTRSIVIYMESVGNARSFLSAAREVALSKPIIVIKAGRTAAAAKAAASHTGSLAGSDEVLEAAFRRSGVLRVRDIADLFYMAEVFAKQPRPTGPNLTIITNAGGPGVLATDALIGSGGSLTELSEQTMKELNDLLPPHWSHNNPIDVLGDADPERYARALEIGSRDQNADGMLVILTPQDMTDPTQTAEALKTLADLGKPILASWMGGASVAAGMSILDRANIPTFPYPDTATRVFNYMWRYSYNLRGIYETPASSVMVDREAWDRGYAMELVECARGEGRTILTEVESKELMAAYKIPTCPTRKAEDADQAVEIAEKMGYPVVLKLFSLTITHKTDVGGVQLNLNTAEEVRQAWKTIEESVTQKAGAEHFQGCTVQPMLKFKGYELIIGSSIDPQFGPVLLFGSGGQLVEVMRDRSLALPPLTTTLARRMIEQTKAFEVIQGVRGQAGVDMSELEQIMVRFSQLVVDMPWIKEIDINPLLASPEGFMALDARVVLHDPETREEDLPKLAIRPYPTEYIQPAELRDGTKVTIRPIRPDDEPLMVDFHKKLSEQSVYNRFLQTLPLSDRITHERLARICFNDFDRQITLVAEWRNPATASREILGVARIGRLPGTNDADFSMTIRDDWQHKGLGTQLLKNLVEVGRNENLDKVVSAFLPEREDMKHIFEKMGFTAHHEEGETLMRVELELNTP